MPVGDTRLVVDVGAIRPDLLSHRGVAREVSAVIGQPCRLPTIPGADPAIAAPKASPGTGATGGVQVSVEGSTRTRRYMGAVVKGVAVGPSPDWLVRRLEAAGVRSINNIVDATNYVLHELGQPVHAFDLAKLGGRVVVRLARAGEKLVTLDGAARELPVGARRDRRRRDPAGGGRSDGRRDSEVGEGTRDLFIEVASLRFRAIDRRPA